jgi:hypothetical protein
MIRRIAAAAMFAAVIGPASARTIVVASDACATPAHAAGYRRPEGVAAADLNPWRDGAADILVLFDAPLAGPQGGAVFARFAFRIDEFGPRAAFDPGACALAGE